MSKNICNKVHRYWKTFDDLPYHQGGDGRHHCAGCAYELGFQDGFDRRQELKLDFDALPESQAGTIRHTNLNAAYAQGYLDGVRESFEP